MSTATQVREFDLNIERVLEHWTVAHGLREVIANALDEQALTGTEEPKVYKDDNGAWHIRDAGRGLHYRHLTQNENREKLTHSDIVIGKFGVGLKDAFATFDRHHIQVLIRSAHSDITIAKAPKHGFTDVPTLHAMIHPPIQPRMVGTDFIVSGVKDEDVAKAKDFFLHYSGDTVLERTAHGQVLRHTGKGRKARIYVHGLHVADEENFLFSYNITSLTAALRRALNRERTNVGRGAYSDRVRAILLQCTTSDVAGALAGDLQSYDRGTAHDELSWQDVQLHACRILNANEQVVFVTSEQLLLGGSLITHARDDGYRIVVIPSSLGSKLPNLVDLQGNPIRDLGEYRAEWNQSFNYSLIDPRELTREEVAVYAHTDSIIQLFGKRVPKLKQIMISETMRLNRYDSNEAVGVWEEEQQRIIIKRTQLCNIATYASTLLHEITHAATGADDVTTEFEHGLTDALGRLATAALKPTR